MADPYFKLRREVHVVRNHCASCSKLESQMQHPIKVRAILAYGEGFTYRIEDAKGACFNISEACLCSSSSGHSSTGSSRYAMNLLPHGLGVATSVSVDACP